jgi:CDP-glycerol glycerophosphotransferase (TagB/SpsB family)
MTAPTFPAGRGQPTLKRIVRGIGRRIGMRSMRADVDAIEATGLFDHAGYLARYPDVAAAGIHPVVHYLDTGAREGRNPCELFDSAYYLERNPDVAAAGLNPLLHFHDTGWREARDPGPDFDAGWYVRTHLGNPGDAMDPLLHYLAVGRAAGLEIRAVADAAADLVRASGVFDEVHYVGEHPDVAGTGADPVSHYLRHGADEGRNPSAMFDTRYYLRNNPDVAASGENPLVHFCRVGWKELRNPSRDFDVWWYWSRHMDPTVEGDNPLGHYQALGRDAGLDPRPPIDPAQATGSGYRHPTGRPRRICLFAGYDRDGIVDDYVIDYVRELARHCDVYYLADSDMRPGELDKLAGLAKAAWAERHGQYDFGSYSRLAQRVGWDRIAEYDELLLVNDSCYLLRPLDGVFAKMDARPCDWWGLQATKGLIATRRHASNRFRQPIPMAAVRDSLLSAFERDYQYDFHVGSYFVAFRRPVIADAHFRRLLDSVSAQESKKTLILKYEIGLTRHLIARGLAFDTFIDALYPFHPIFTNWYFSLLDKGFPLLKRYFLSENHYAVPGLHDWAARILEKVPGADVETARRNVERVTDPERLHRNLHIGTERVVDDLPVPEALLDDEAFLEADRATPKYRTWWAFPVCAFTGVFSGNERALFEEVKDDPSIRKIVLTRDKPVAVDGANVEVIPLESPLGQHRLMRAGNLFIKHSPTRNLVYPVSGDLHNIINLWHGIPFKRIGYASADMQDRLAAIAGQHARCRAVISSSKVDTLAMTAAFYPLSIDEVWNTGLPRNDFILRERERLPADLQEQLASLERMLAGRRLVLFMPTFRNAQEDAYYRFGEDEVAFLGDWLRRNDAVLGVREHMADSARVYGRQLAGLDCLDLSDDAFPNVEVLYRASSALVTDYSSSFIDYMLTGKPAVSFAYDYERYLGIERGGFYDLDFVFPGPVCRSFAELREALEGLFEPRSAVESGQLDWKRRLFFDHVDDGSSARVAERVKLLTDTTGLGKSPHRIGAP